MNLRCKASHTESVRTRKEMQYGWYRRTNEPRAEVENDHNAIDHQRDDGKEERADHTQKLDRI